MSSTTATSTPTPECSIDVRVFPSTTSHIVLSFIMFLIIAGIILLAIIMFFVSKKLCNLHEQQNAFKEEKSAFEKRKREFEESHANQN